MKPKILLCFIAILYSSIVFSQNITEKSKFLFAIIPVSGPNPFLYTDTLDLLSSNADTQTFKLLSGISKPKDYFLKQGPLIYKINESDTLLMYDYDLQESDTFYISFDGFRDSLIVDSIRMVLLEDGLLHKHWFFRSLYWKTNSPHLVWIENYGERTYGWDYSSYRTFHSPPLMAICNGNDQLILWDNYFLDLYSDIATCNFDSVMRIVSLPEKNLIKGIQIFPNPVNGEYITVNCDSEFEYSIMNMMGIELLNGYSIGRISIGDLVPGIYCLSIRNQNLINCFVLIRE